MVSHKELIARGWLDLHSDPGAALDLNGTVPVNTINCGSPDKPNESVARAQISEIKSILELDTDEEAIQIRDTHRSMLAFELANATISEGGGYGKATGSGSWAKGCYPPYPNNHAWRVFYETSNLPSHLTRDVTDQEFDSVVVRAGVWDASNITEAKKKWATDDYIATPVNWNVPKTSVFAVKVRLCLEANRRVGIMTILADDGPNGKHNQHAVYEVIPGSTIGLGYFPPANSCNAHVKKIIDRSWTQGLNPQLKLGLHETGHTLGLYHEFTGQGFQDSSFDIAAIVDPDIAASGHHGIMSYSWLAAEPFVGWRKTGNEWVPVADPSIPELISFFGGEEVPWVTDPTQPVPPLPPTEPPSTAPRIENIKVQYAGRNWEYNVTPKDGNGGGFPPIGV